MNELVIQQPMAKSKISRMLPMTYCLGLVRAVVCAGTAEYDSVVLFNPFISFVVIAIITIVCLMIGTFFFARSEVGK